jgi:hypothetical protein
MHWEWIVPVIAVVLWILSSVIRTPEEAPRDLRKRRMPGGPQRPPAPQPGKPPTEVDRFLEEINNLRRRAAAEEQRPGEAPQRPLRPAEERRPVAKRPPRPRPTAPPPGRPVVMMPPSSVVPPPPPAGATVALAVEVLDVLPAAPASAPPIPIVAGIAKDSPAVTQLLSLLRTPATLQTAVLLQEVLGKPRCHRSRRTPGR